MAIVHNTTTSSSTSSASSLTFAHTTSGSNKALFVGVVTRNNAVTPTSVTHNGNALTRIDIQTGTSLAVSLYYMVNPDSSGNVVITLAASNNIIGIANSYTGVHQSSPLGTFQFDRQNTTPGGATSITLSSATGELCVDVFGNASNDTPNITGGQTARGTVNSASQIHGAMSEETGATSVTMSWSIATSFRQRMQIGVPVKPSSAAAEEIIFNYSDAFTSICYLA